VITFSNWPKPLLIAATVVLVLIVAMVDLLTGDELSFYVFYFMPVIFAAWNLSGKWAAATACLCTIGWLGEEYLAGHVYSTKGMLVANTSIRLISYLLMGYFFSKLRQSRAELRMYANELEQRVAQRTYKLQERVAELEMVSYAVSHNLRAPLRAMGGMAHFLEEYLQESEGKSERGGDPANEARGYLARIKSSAARMDRLVLDLVGYVQLTIHEPELRLIPAAAVLAEVLAEHRAMIEEKNAEVDIVGKIPPVLGDNRMLHTVLFQLVNNALKFVDPGSTPRITVGTDEMSEGRVRFWVRDSGIGINRTHLERIFHVFEQLHSYGMYGGGTGMGLAMAKKCVEKMGGRIGAESSEGKGATFWFEVRKYGAAINV
jgi:signal transduction histidine kinase